MKVAVYQTDPILLDIKANLEDTISKIHHAKEKKADLIVFPELALTGYFVGEKYHEVALKIESKEIKKLALATKGTAAIVGFIEESKSMNFYNSALIAVDGEVLFAYRKLNLPNYGVFEERKYFSNGKRVSTFRLHGYNLSVFICNDMWHPALPYLGICQKADIFITIFNSSQGSMGSEFRNIESWEIINRFYSRVFGIYNICANRVGFESFEEKRDISKENLDEEEPLRFWGGSEIINPFGKQIAKAALYKPDMIFGEISRDLLRRKKILLPYLRDDEPHFTYRELNRILYDKK
ncbi:MAG: nitrilase [Proteobacteria bacterium]|nr:nitrilase [Desulfobacteraceae bacterium]MBU2521415.1 nitrilase [Pseudomonadota bacterium]MBU3979974.1 nitrilase [Pseudomonadota bacterium]MBU4012541.1 nitrilase [Pseudomonadota bacterium]MBU4068341.1 nitrilase [Pseudomonadota bacterium]